MREPDEATRVRHMVDAAREALEFVKGVKRGDLDEDRLRLLALTRLIEVIGEASNHVTERTKSEYPRIPWPAIRGMRNRIVHAYFEIDVDLLWDTLHHDLPALIEQLEAVLASLESK